jgi:xanthine/uracil permease
LDPRIIFLELVIALLASLLTAWRVGRGRGRTLAIVLAVVSGIALIALVGLLLFALAINRSWSSR